MPESPNEVLLFDKEIFHMDSRIKDLADGERLRARRKRMVLLRNRFKASVRNAVHSALPKDSLEEAVHYALTRWIALTRLTEAGYLVQCQSCN